MGFSFSQSGSALAYQFAPETYGAKGDGSTDDTAAIQTAINAAAAYAAANNGYAEVVFQPLVYALTSATTKTSTNKGNAQLTLPLVAATALKLTIVLRGVRDATALPHWNQTVPQLSGTVLKSTLTGLAYDATWGAPSVVGGPTPEQGYGQSASLFDNILIVVDGITIVVPGDSTIAGWDFRGLAEANATTIACLANQTPTQMNAAAPTHDWAFGLAMPQTNNNDNCTIWNYSCEGLFIGLLASEHTYIANLRIVYCLIGIEVWDSFGHGMVIDQASVEVCQTYLQPAGPGVCKVRIAALDCEDGADAFAIWKHINDSGNGLFGEVGYTNTTSEDPIVNGAANLRIVNLLRPPGHVTAPSVPSSTVAFQNPFWRDAMVVVTGGVVSAIAVDGTATGLVATGAVVIVPTGRTIALTYSVAPSWDWVLF